MIMKWKRWMNSEQSEHKNHNRNKRLPNVMLTLHFDNEIQINIFHITQCYKNWNQFLIFTCTLLCWTLLSQIRQTFRHSEFAKENKAVVIELQVKEKFNKKTRY